MIVPLLLLALIAWPALGSAQVAEPPIRLEPVVVTPARIEQQAGEAPASVTVITADDILHSPNIALDDLLRQVPSFSLFRRSSSVVGHPTTQGVSLRGIGPSGASRALVLVDGAPINDPFGGWVPWSRVSPLGIEQIEVVRGRDVLRRRPAQQDPLADQRHPVGIDRDRGAVSPSAGRTDRRRSRGDPRNARKVS